MYALAPAQYFPVGLGDVQSANQTVALGAAGAGSAAAIAGAAGLIPVAAIPFIGPAIAGVALLATALIKNSGCGPTCIQASEYANQAGQLMDRNLHNYFYNSSVNLFFAGICGFENGTNLIRYIKL